MTQGYLTTHILDTAQGRPAQNIKISVYTITENKKELKAEMTTNADGRTDSPILPQGDFPPGQYELVFHVGPYLAEHFPQDPAPFFDDIPVPFTTHDADAHYHIPLLLSPYGYSTYRGS